MQSIFNEPTLLSQSNDLFQTANPVSPQQLFDGDSNEAKQLLQETVATLSELNKLSKAAETSQLKIGIVTMPVLPQKQHLFQSKEYILDINRHFIQLSGATAVPVHYNTEEEQLY